MPPLLAPILAAVGLTLAVPNNAKVPTRGLLPPGGSCPGEAQISGPPSTQVAATRCLLNAVRARAGLATLRNVTRLDRSALLRSTTIRRCDDFSHTPCGQSFLRPFVETGYFVGSVEVGETLAWGQGSLGSPRATVAEWLRSPPHREILLTPGWRDVGVSLVRSPRLFGRPHVTVWVAQFGRRS